jgi:putative cardiolipin synthase
MTSPRPFVVISALLVSACAVLPPDVQRIESTALTNTDNTRLGQAIGRRTAANPGKDGIHPMTDARDAFAARVLLARAAERSLDLQYYIWHGDTTGQLLREAVWQAAERGVRVRMLLDDANTGGLDATIAALDAHPNIEVRLFNPFANRGFKLADFAIDFARVNRRMHNKSFTADNQAAIVGGRNVGDEYYGASAQVEFADLDVLAIGPVVREVSREFDLYWNSKSAYPAASVLPPAEPDGASRLREGWEKVHQDPAAVVYRDAVGRTPLVRQLLAGDLPVEWTKARVVHDDPSKVLVPPEQTDLHMLPHLEQALGKPMRELDLVSPYFIPGKLGTEGLRALAGRGVKVRVLTNSLAATDVAPVHAGYSKYREDLLGSGVRLYELKPSVEGQRAKDHAEREGIGSVESAGLHAKTFAVDRSRIFVGSFNLDPRSARINTEMGIVMDSPSLASRLSERFDSGFPGMAYEVRLATDRSGLEWVDRSGQSATRTTSEPGAGWLRRQWIRFLSILPIERLL